MTAYRVAGYAEVNSSGRVFYSYSTLSVGIRSRLFKKLDTMFVLIHTTLLKVARWKTRGRGPGVWKTRGNHYFAQQLSRNLLFQIAMKINRCETRFLVIKAK